MAEERGMIDSTFYQEYLEALLQGRRADCGRRVQQLLDQDIDIKNLYTDLFQKSLYEVGRLWELNRISVAREHLVTAITEGLLGLVYPRLFDSDRPPASRKVVISCAANEYHQIGGKMVADVFEMNGWESHFLGANTPIDQMLAHIGDTKPDLVGLSLSVYFNLAPLKKRPRGDPGRLSRPGHPGGRAGVSMGCHRFSQALPRHPLRAVSRCARRPDRVDKPV